MSTEQVAYVNYLELRKMRENRIGQLKEGQKRVQQHEHGLTKMKNHIAKLLSELGRVQHTFDQMVDGDIWVTAKDHDQIHTARHRLEDELDTYTALLYKRHKAIEKEADQAKLHASHIIGIERALPCLEEHMRQQIKSKAPSMTSSISVSSRGSSFRSSIASCHSKVNPIIYRLQQAGEQVISFKQSKSQHSLSSVLSHNINQSKVLSGSLLKKWFKKPQDITNKENNR